MTQPPAHTRLRWPDLASGRADAASGRTVEVQGWMHPVEEDGSGDYFALVPEAPCCLGCIPRDPDQAIEVFATGPIPCTGLPIRLRGTWHRLRDDRAGWRHQLRGAELLGASGSASRQPMLGRRGLLATGPLMCLAACAPGAVRAETPVLDTAAGRAAIADAVTVDIHSHAGGVASRRRVQGDLPLLPLAGPMRDGGLAVACLAAVSDGSAIKVVDGRRIQAFRDPEPGELYAYTQLGFARIHRIAQEQGLAIVADAAGLRAARGGTPSIVVAAEGGDFLEGRPDRVDEALARWRLRHLQLTHYRVNELGDIQTEAPVHGGLTDTGVTVIRRCNALGVVVDVAHGTYDLVKRAAAVTTKPLVLSHTSLATRPGPRSRLITPDHARAVAGTGGVIGLWPPASIFPDLPALARGMARMADVVGVDHVALGSDMLGLVGPSALPGYEALPDLAAALLGQGFQAEDVRKILGGNYARVFATCLT